MTKEAIKELIAQNHLAEAIDQLMTLVNAYLLIHQKDQIVAKIQQVLIINSGKYKGLEQEQVLGILNREDEQITIAQVLKALLYTIDELPEKVWQSKIDVKVQDTLLPATHSSDFDFDLFLSFSSKDREAARLIWETLRGLGYRVFLSDETLKAYAGMSFLDKINSALRKSQHFLLLCTPTAVESHWVKLECETFFTRFHLHQAHQRRFFILERGGKKALADVYQNLQTLDDLQTLLELLQTQFAPNTQNSPIPPVYALPIDARSKHQAIMHDFEFIKGGVFMMGALVDEPQSQNFEKPQHWVQVSDFYMSKYPITLAQFGAFILASGYQNDADKDGGSNFWTGENWDKRVGINWTCNVKGNPQQNKRHPVIHVSWNDAKAYCTWLAQQLGMLVRLPREAEWEYACRAGTNTPFNTGDNLTTEQANYNGNYPYHKFSKGSFLQHTSPVGSYPANDWGLYDMHGNVFEWCEDWYSETWYEESKKKGTVLDPTGPVTGAERVLRGGSWYSHARYCRSARRHRDGPDNRGPFAGFRPVVSL